MASPRTAEAELPPLGFLLLAGLTLFWGLNWPAMKIALTELPVWWFRAACVWAGALGLLGIARLSGQTLVMPAKECRWLLLCAAFNVVAWHLTTGYGISLMPAGRAAIIAFTMPLWAALLGSVVLGEALSRAKIVGLTLGLIGLGVLIGQDLMVFHHAPLGAIFMLLAALAWASGTVAVKRFRWTIPASVLMGWQLAAGALPLSLGAILLEPLPDLGALSGETWAALAYIFVFPMVFCQWAYTRTVRIFPASLAAIGTLLIPVVGVYASAVILGEAVGWPELAALVLICGGLASVLLAGATRRPPRLGTP